MATIPKVVKDQARDLLKRLTMKNLRTLEHGRGVAWTAVLCIDGKPLCEVSQEGRGGGNRYEPIKGGDRAVTERSVALLEGACSVLGLGDSAALDLLTAAMEDGMTGHDALPLARDVLKEA